MQIIRLHLSPTEWDTPGWVPRTHVLTSSPGDSDTITFWRPLHLRFVIWVFDIREIRLSWESICYLLLKLESMQFHICIKEKVILVEASLLWGKLQSTSYFNITSFKRSQRSISWSFRFHLFYTVRRSLPVVMSSRDKSSQILHRKTFPFAPFLQKRWSQGTIWHNWKTSP